MEQGFFTYGLTSGVQVDVFSMEQGTCTQLDIYLFPVSLSELLIGFMDGIF